MSMSNADSGRLESMDTFAERLSGRLTEPPAQSQGAPRSADSGSGDAQPDLHTGLDRMQQYHAAVEELPGWRRIGDILIELGFATPEQIEEGLKAQRQHVARRKKTVGLLEALQESGIITAAQAQHALNHQIAHGYLPALANALTERDRAIVELRATYQQSLQTIARYVEEAQNSQRELAELRKQVLELKTAAARRKP